MSNVTDEQAQTTFAYNLTRLMAEHAVTQSELSSQLNESNARIHNYRTGKKMPGIGIATRIAEFFDVSVSDMLTPAPKKKSKKKSKVPA